jgi:ATPase subunit of ABC transporter with duplicated ATPase domains
MYCILHFALLYICIYVCTYSIKKRNEEHLQFKVATHVSREMAVKEAQAKSAAERQERRAKIANSKRLIEENRKAVAAQAKEASHRIEQLKLMGRAKEEYDKRAKAEEEKKRSVGDQHQPVHASCHIMSCLVVSCRIVSCRVVSCRVVSCRFVSFRVVSCRVVGVGGWL